MMFIETLISILKSVKKGHCQWIQFDWQCCLSCNKVVSGYGCGRLVITDKSFNLSQAEYVEKVFT